MSTRVSLTFGMLLSAYCMYILRFHNKWLRFNCHCKKCYRFIVGQQRINCSLFPDDFPILDAKVDGGKTYLSNNIDNMCNYLAMRLQH